MTNTNINFRTTEERKRFMRILAARGGYENSSEWLNALIDREIERLSPEEHAVLLGESLPKASGLPQAEQEKRRR